MSLGPAASLIEAGLHVRLTTLLCCVPLPLLPGNTALRGAGAAHGGCVDWVQRHAGQVRWAGRGEAQHAALVSQADRPAACNAVCCSAAVQPANCTVLFSCCLSSSHPALQRADPGACCLRGHQRASGAGGGSAGHVASDAGAGAGQRSGVQGGEGGWAVLLFGASCGSLDTRLPAPSAK